VGVHIGSWAREVLERPQAFGTLATLSPVGWPHQAVVWFTLVGDDLLVNSAEGRRWPAYLTRDPRCSILVGEAYEWVGMRCLAERLDDPAQAQADIAAMARRYHAQDPERAERLIRDGFSHQERVSFLLHPQAVVEHPDR
jgi:hypothetical protein